MRLPPFYPIVDADWLKRSGRDALETTRELLAAGAEILQFRDKGGFDRAAFELARSIGGLAREAGCLFVINDRTDIALMLGADGVHLGQDDPPPAAVRRLAGDRLIIGYSTHNREQLEAGNREPVDYLAFGPVFATRSKERPDPEVGLERLAAARKLTRKPLTAIGGITRERAAAAYEAGADSVAVISGIDGWLAAARSRTKSAR